jgi:NADH-quinone oxidoreductase subunit A
VVLAMPLWPLWLYVAMVVATVGGMLALSHVLGQRRSHAGAEPYESGIVSTGSARLRFPANFYLVAMFFVIFDLESVFFFAWAVAVRDLGWAGYCEVLVLTGMLIAALVYLWKTGALDWTTGGAVRRADRPSERRAQP